MSTSSVSRKGLVIYGLVALLTAGLMIACGSSSSTSTAPSATSTATTAFQGTIAGSTSSQTGTLDMTVQATVASLREMFSFPFVATLNAQSPSASGTLHLAGGATAALTGTWTSATNAISVAGGGFTVTGTSTAGVLKGQYTGPGGTSGGFSTLSTTAGAVTKYCGTFLTVIPSQSYTETGQFNIQTSLDGRVSGLFSTTSPTHECCGFVTGHVSGSTVTLITNDATGDITSTGTVQGGTLSGSNPTRTPGGTTSFSGSSSACQ